MFVCVRAFCAFCVFLRFCSCFSKLRFCVPFFFLSLSLSLSLFFLLGFSWFLLPFGFEDQVPTASYHHLSCRLELCKGPCVCLESSFSGHLCSCSYCLFFGFFVFFGCVGDFLLSIPLICGCGSSSVFFSMARLLARVFRRWF